jgi:hypothetical protein
MAVIAKRLALAGKNRGAKQHKVIHPTNRVVKDVMAVGTGSYIIGIRMIRIQHYV